MKRNIIEHLFNAAITILKRSVISSLKISRFETIVITVEKNQLRDNILYNKKVLDKN
jgi:hypothetical protein